MKKNIIVDSGPTNERLDAVMKITNMSTGALGSIITDTLIKNYDDEIENVFYISPKLCYKPKSESEKIKYIQIDSTDDLLNVLEELFSNYKIDAIVHSAAVGDYKGKYMIRAEDLASEMADKIINSISKDTTKEDIENLILNVFDNPNVVCNDDTKISSNEKRLMAMLELTPKIISKIKKMNKDVKLIGFKLLEGVSEDTLYDVAHKLLMKNKADYIVANLLDRIGNGKHFAMIIDKDGIREKCNNKVEIAKSISKLIFEN